MATWSISSTVSVTGTISRIVADPLDAYRAFTSASSGASGYVYSIFDSAIEDTHTFAGSADDIQAGSGVVFVLDNTNNSIHCLGHADNISGFVNFVTISLSQSAHGLYYTAGDLYILQDNAEVNRYRQTGNVSLEPGHRYGMSIYGGSSWTPIYSTGTRQIMAMTPDNSGNVFAVTDDNTLYYMSGTGTAMSSGYPQNIPDPSGQISGVKIGINALHWDGTTLYASSSLYGSLIKITPA